MKALSSEQLKIFFSLLEASNICSSDDSKKDTSTETSHLGVSQPVLATDQTVLATDQSGLETDKPDLQTESNAPRILRVRTLAELTGRESESPDSEPILIPDPNRQIDEKLLVDEEDYDNVSQDKSSKMFDMSLSDISSSELPCSEASLSDISLSDLSSALPPDRPSSTITIVLSSSETSSSDSLSSSDSSGSSSSSYDSSSLGSSSSHSSDDDVEVIKEVIVRPKSTFRKDTTRPRETNLGRNVGGKIKEIENGKKLEAKGKQKDPPIRQEGKDEKEREDGSEKGGKAKEITSRKAETRKKNIEEKESNGKKKEKATTEETDQEGGKPEDADFVAVEGRSIGAGNSSKDDDSNVLKSDSPRSICSEATTVALSHTADANVDDVTDGSVKSNSSSSDTEDLFIRKKKKCRKPLFSSSDEMHSQEKIKPVTGIKKLTGTKSANLFSGQFCKILQGFDARMETA